MGPITDIFDAPHPLDQQGGVISPHDDYENSGGRDTPDSRDYCIDTEPLPHSPEIARNDEAKEAFTMEHGEEEPYHHHSNYNSFQQNHQTSFIQQSMPFGGPAMPNTMAPMTMWGAAGDPGVQHPGDKPKRPLSAYNFFFQLERERIIKCDEEDREKVVEYTVEDVARIAMIQQKKAKENKPKEKRSHRKTHGKISFGDLARTIAMKWKKLDNKSKSIFEGSAALEKERYRKELAEWNKQQKKWKEATTRMTMQPGATTMLYPGSYPIVTPPQIPKKTVAGTMGVPRTPEGVVEEDSMMATLVSQQQKLLQQSTMALTKNNTAPSRVSKQEAQPQGNHQQQQLIPNKMRKSSHPGHASRRFSTGMMPGYEMETQPHTMYNQGLARMDSNPIDYYDDGDDMYLNNDSHSDFHDVADNTYDMANMTLPQHGNNFHHQRMMMQQQRMRTMMMQQQQRQQQQYAMMRNSLGGFNNSQQQQNNTGGRKLHQQMLMNGGVNSSFGQYVGDDYQSQYMGDESHRSVMTGP